MSRTRVPNPGADAIDEIRERNRRAQLNLSVLMKGFGSEMQGCYSHEEAEELLEEMNKQLPLAIKEAAEAYGAYAPVRRRHIARRRSVVN